MVLNHYNIDAILGQASKPATVEEKFNYCLNLLAAYFEFSEPLEEINEIAQLVEFGKTYYLKQKDQNDETLLQFLILDAKLKILQWNLKQAIENIKLFEPLLKKVDDKIYWAYYFNLKGNQKFLKQLHNDAAKHYNKALKILKSIPGGVLKHKRLYVVLNNLLFVTLSEINKFERAFQFYFEVIKFGMEHKTYYSLTYALNNSALMFSVTKNVSFFKKAKKNMLYILKETQSKYVKECVIHVELLEVHIEYKDIDKSKYFKILERTLDKHKNTFNHASRKYLKAIYLMYRLEIAFYKCKKEDLLLYCNQLNSLLQNSESSFYYNLFYELTRLCILDEQYLKTISEMPSYKKYNINNSIDNLFKLLVKFTKTRRVSNRILIYNLIIDYYKNKPPTDINFKIFTNCISELQKVCTDTSKFRMAHIETKQLNQKEIKKKDRLLASQKELVQFFKEFSYTAAHDLKAPIQTITGFAQIIKQSYNQMPVEKAQEYLEKIISTGETMTGFINEIMNFEKHYTFNPKNFVAVDLRKVVNQVKTNLSSKIEQSGCTINILFQRNSVFARKSPLEMLFQNLISNAIKYRRPDVPPKIEINYTKNNNVISVKDNGIGISADMHQKIFKPFFRIPHENVISTGIGLATCKKIVESFGGKIWLESKVGKGSTFYFTLNAK